MKPEELRDFLALKNEVLLRKPQEEFPSELEAIFQDGSQLSIEPNSGAFVFDFELLNEMKEDLEKINDYDESILYLPSPSLSKETWLRKAFYIILSLCFGIGINVYNTVLFSPNRLNLGLPLFVSTIFDVTQLSLALITLVILEWQTGPGLSATFKMISPNRLVRFLMPCGVAAALNIALSNTSLQHISLSFYTMVKSSSPVFVLIFAFLFGLESPNRRLFAIIAIILLGTILTVWDAVDFNLIGFSLIFSAAIVSGFRWTMTQIIIAHHSTSSEDDPDGVYKAGPLRTMIFLAPIVGGTLGLLSLVFEGPKAISRSPFFTGSSAIAWDCWLYGLFGGVLTFILVLLEYKVIQETSVLTFSILGIVKELLIVAISIAVFGDQVKMINIVGACITICGILMYQLHKVKVNNGHSPISSERRRKRKITDAAMTHMFSSAPSIEPALPINLDDSTSSEASSPSGYPRAPSMSPIMREGVKMHSRRVRTVSVSYKTSELKEGNGIHSVIPVLSSRPADIGGNEA